MRPPVAVDGALPRCEAQLTALKIVVASGKEGAITCLEAAWEESYVLLGVRLPSLRRPFIGLRDADILIFLFFFAIFPYLDDVPVMNLISKSLLLMFF